MINDVLILQRNIVVAANYFRIQPHATELTWPTMRDVYEHPELNTIDMVIVGDWDWHIEFSSKDEFPRLWIDYLSVIIQYGYIIHRHASWKKFTLRLIQILPGCEESECELMRTGLSYSP